MSLGNMLACIVKSEIKTDFGIFDEAIYTDGQNNAYCLSLGDVHYGQEIYIRIHSHCHSSHVFLGTGCDCREQMQRSQQIIQQQKLGLIIWLDQDGRANGYPAKVASEKWKKQGLSQDEAYIAAGFSPDKRNYDLAIKVIKSLNIKSAILLTNNKFKQKALVEAGVTVKTLSV